jgi:hypothetical protein
VKNGNDLYGKVMVKMGIYCEHTFEDADFLLRRNWFLDIRDFHRFMNELDEDVFAQIVQNRNRYHPNLRWALYESEVPARFVRTPVKDISDAEWQSMKSDREKERLRRVKEHKKTFVPPPRPRDDLDDMVDDAKAEIDERKEDLDALLAVAKKAQKYMPPGRRTQIGDDDPTIRSARAHLASLENGFGRAKELLEASNKTWSELAWCDAMLRDAAKRPSFLTSAPATTHSA